VAVNPTFSKTKSLLLSLSVTKKSGRNTFPMESEALGARLRTYKILIGIILLTLPCYCAGFLALTWRLPNNDLTPTPTLLPTVTSPALPSVTAGILTLLPPFTAGPPTRTLEPSPTQFAPPSRTPSYTPTTTDTPTSTATTTITLTPSSTPTVTSTSAPTITHTPTPTVVPASQTSVPPTPTGTSVPPTHTLTATAVPPTATETQTATSTVAP
jgi:hypothetical protein